MNTYKSFIYIFFPLILLFVSCKTQQVREGISTQIPDNYLVAEQTIQDSSNWALAGWKEFFKDAHLQNLIETGLENNQDVLKTLQNIRIAQADLKRARLGRLPEINGIAGVYSRRFGEYTMDGVGNTDSNLSPTVPEDKKIPDPYRDFILGAEFGWEIDVWGRLNMRRKQATAQYLASVEMTNHTKTWLIAEIATHYYHLIGLDEEIETLLSNISFQEQAYELGKSLKATGKDSQLSLDQFEGLMLNSKGVLVSKRRERQNVILSLSRLLGTYPENYERPPLSEVDIPEAVQVGLPSDLLRLRPDIRQGENQLRANDLEVGIARTAFFPSFRLFGMAGFNAFEFSKLFLNPASTAYQLGAGLTAPLFNRGQIRAAYESAKANQQIALLDYEQTVLKSYLEVLGLVNDFSTLEEEIQLKNDEVIVQRRSVDNAGTMFKVGYADYLDVINAQSRSLESELDYINLKVAQLQSTVKLYRALGGGWQ
ncbi:efflux transporter outer membrane subunit [Negadavirga shengliensis]|uniref:Efflux transporter outer membrane subunit n=1 Tax=Negadavirga shengliensis TaxID=1389218 RepID=A0ABV9T284_9BACT